MRDARRSTSVLTLVLLFSTATALSCAVDSQPAPPRQNDNSAPDNSMENNNGDVVTEAERGFGCAADSVGAGKRIASTRGAGGESVWIRPSAVGPCMFSLHYRLGDGSEERIDTQPGGFLFAVSVATPGDTRLVCTSDIQNSVLSEGRHRIDRVPIQCARFDGERWLTTREVIAPDGAWAAWIQELSHPPGSSDEFMLTFTRDATFHILNWSATNRPASDGVYNARVKATETGFELVATTRTEAPIKPSLDADSVMWEPTDEDKARMGDRIDFSAAP